MSGIWTTLFYQPLYNILILFVGFTPKGDVGLAIILLTVLVKLILFPLSQKSIKSQAEMRAIEPELRALKEKYKDKEERAKKTMELYKTHKINPFSGCLLILVQLPIIFALYYVFLKGLDFQKDLLYSWVTIPLEINPNFLGFIDIHKKSLILAILAGLSQFFLGRITLVSPKKTTEGEEKKDFQTELAKSMNMQAKYILPIFIAFVSYQISAGVALYWATSNIFTIAQEFYVRKKLKKLHLEHIKPASL